MKSYSPDFRQKIIDVRLQENLSIRQLAARFKVAKSFVQKLLKQYAETGAIKAQKPGGNQKRKLDDDQVVTLIEIIENNNDATLAELCELLQEKTQVKMGITTMWKLTKKLNYSWKKKTMYAAEKHTNEVQKKRVAFWQIIRAIAAKDLIFIDEAGVNLAMTRLYARAEKGERARGEKPQKKGTNVTMLSALSLEKVLASINIYGSVDGLIFEAFIVRKLVPNLWAGAVVIMDNAKIHFGEMVKKSIEDTGAKLIYLSPYSPDFSPIENFWSKVKAILKKIKSRNYQDLINAITDAMLKVTKKDIHNWFAHCCYCTS